MLKPELDMEVRWNSTYKMIRRLIRQKDLLMEFYTQEVSHEITNFEWEIIEQFKDILEIFYNSTNTLSGVYYPTTPLVLGELYLMSAKLAEYKTIPIWQQIIADMVEKLLKYFETLPPVFTCAAALNPSLNVGGVENLLEGISEALSIDPNDNTFQTLNTQYFNNIFRELYTFYDAKYGPVSKGKESFSGSASSNEPTKVSKSLLYQMAARKKTKTSSSLDELGIFTQSQFSIYIGEEQFHNFDILKWWKEKAPQFPVMSAIARDLLTVQASTVASESSFSLSGRILNERRTRLSPKSLVLCVCLKDYFDSVRRQQHKATLEDGLKDIEDDIIEDEGSETASPPEIDEDTIPEDPNY